MRILHAIIEDYKPFEFARYKSVKIVPTTNIQIIVGKNGAGKSSLLKALNPFPAKKNYFNKRGAKEIQLSHNGFDYTLISDFKEKDHVHSFIKGDEELNVSGLSTIQEELISRELGINSLSLDLMFNRIHFSGMSKNERKTHILNINPFDLFYFLELHKKTSSKIRECKNNIKMLNERQADLESKIANKTILEAKTKEKDTLVELKTILDKVIFTINRYISQYETQLNGIEKTNVSLDEVKNKNYEIQEFLLKTIGLPKQINVSTSEIARLETDIKTIEEEQLWELVKEIDSYNDQLTELSTSTKMSSSDLEKKIKDYEAELKTLHPKDGLPCLPDNMDLEWYRKFVDEIANSTTSLIGHSVSKFITIDQEYKVNNLIKDINNLIVNMTNKFNDAQEKQLVIKKEIKEGLFPPKDRIDCDICDLFKDHSSRMKKLQKDRDNYLLIMKDSEKKLKTLNKRLNLVQDYGQTYISPSKMFRVLQDKVRSLGIFSGEWLYKDFTDMLLKQPLRLTEVLEIVYLNTVNKRKSIKLEKELLEMISSLDKMKHTSKTTKEFLEKMLTDKLAQRKILTNRLSGYASRLNELKYLLNIKTQQERHLQDLNYYKQELSIKEKRATLVATMRYYKKMEEACTSIQQSVDQDLRALEIFLNEQNSLIDRYTKEIVPLLEKTNKEKVIYEDLEMALSPTSGIPHKYLIKSLNSYINTVNTIINQVWTYPLTIVPVSESDELNFVFPIKVDEVLVPDISECSTGQRCIIDFAWNIVGIMGRKLQDYPLYLDEADDGLDVTHKQRFLNLLKTLVDNKIISQLLMVSHHAVMSEGFSDSDVIALSDENIVVPEHANHCVVFN